MVRGVEIIPAAIENAKELSLIHIYLDMRILPAPVLESPGVLITGSSTSSRSEI